jgi:heme exporter protein CcmD
MDWSADHAGFVVASYILSATFIAGLIGFVFLRDRRMRETLSEYEREKS